MSELNRNFKPTTLRAFAEDFLAEVSGPVALEPSAGARLERLARAVAAGEMDGPGLVAAASVRSAPRVKTPATAVVELTGVLTPGPSLFSAFGVGTSVRSFIADMTRAVDDRAVQTIVIAIDSPGGNVQIVPEAADVVYRARRIKPVVGLVLGQCCSAAYWIASAARLEATPSAIVGSTRRILDAVAELERALIAARTSAALQQKKARGERVGTLPFGYQLSDDGRTLDEHPGEQAALTFLREKRAAGWTLQRIADVMNDLGFRTRRGGKWVQQYIRARLSAGERRR